MASGKGVLFLWLLALAFRGLIGILPCLCYLSSLPHLSAFLSRSGITWLLLM